MVHKVLISPAQRFNLMLLAHEYKIPDQPTGRRYRRFMRAFGLAHISKVSRRHGCVLVGYAVDEETQHAISIDDEAIEFLVELAGREHKAYQEDILGDLFDLIDNIKAGRPYDVPTGPALNVEEDTKYWTPPAGATPSATP